MSLADRFAEAAGGQVAPSPALDAALARAHAAGSAAHPEVQLPAEALARHLGRCAGADDPVRAVSEARAEDVYLACAATLGDPRALRIVEADHMAGARKAVMCLDAPQATRDEALQQLRTKLFVASGGGLPHIAQYAGRGALAGWLRVAAVRIALNSLRQSRRRDAREDDWVAGDAAPPLDDPELGYLKQRYQQELERAMTRAFERLADDQRELLRLYVSEGLTLDELARIHDVNASTVSRWLARIRDKLQHDARRHFADACRLEPSECDSLVALVQSHLHVSIQRLLAS